MRRHYQRRKLRKQAANRGSQLISWIQFFESGTLVPGDGMQGSNGDLASDKDRRRWMGWPGAQVQVRGRDASYLAPPAQIRASPIRAHGSHLGYVTARRDILTKFRMCSSACDTSPGTVPGPCFADAHSPRPPPLAPPTPQPVARPCSSASQLLWRGQTSHPAMGGAPVV